MNQHILQGPFLTRREASRRCHVPDRFLAHRPDLLHIGGRSLPEVYLAFQFDEHGVRPNFAHVIQHLKNRFGDREICEWLATPQPELGFATPINYLNSGGDPDRVLEAAAIDGPVLRVTEPPAQPKSFQPPDPSPPPAAASAPRRRSRRIRRSGVRVAHPAR